MTLLRVPLLYSPADAETVVERGSDFRADFRRDVTRLIHCPAFRRLQGKTQLFSGLESDFFRNRLTHSLEVAQVAKSLAIRVNQSEKARDLGWQIDLDLVEFAGLAHDLGHPPFGHTGEYVLHRLMADHGGYEGNAQTLRLLARLEKKLDHHDQMDPDTAELRLYDAEGRDVAVGLNLAARTLASVIKYDHEIPAKTAPQHPVKGYYLSEAPLIDFVRRQVLGDPHCGQPLRTVECQIMDLADDIAYSTNDIEDSFKAGISTPLLLLGTSDEIRAKVCARVNAELAQEGYQRRLSAADVLEVVRGVFPTLGRFGPGAAFLQSRALAEQGELRSLITSWLVTDAVQTVQIEPNLEWPALSRIRLAEEQRVRVAVLKHLTYVLVIESSKLKLVSYRGAKIVQTIFDTLFEQPHLLPPDYRLRFDQAQSGQRHRVVADFVAGMTDRHAVEFYARLTSEDFRSMFQPH